VPDGDRHLAHRLQLHQLGVDEGLDEAAERWMPDPVQVRLRRAKPVGGQPGVIEEDLWRLGQPGVQVRGPGQNLGREEDRVQVDEVFPHGNAVEVN
jgi:hypothetical protein